MSQTPVFTITYWGVTGTFCDPLLPRQVTAKMVDAISTLVEKDCLSGLQPGPNLRQEIRRIMDENLAYWQRSTFGGNTTCLEVQTPDGLIILDCGSGFRELGNSLDARWTEKGEAASRTANVLITHAHIDHTFATPYFTPYYDSRNSLTIWGPQVTLDSLTAVLDAKSALSQVYFPPTYNEMKGIRGFQPIEPGADVVIGGTRVTTYGLNHPGGSMAYRLEHSGKVIVFATDHEHKEVPDRGLADFARGADLLYTEGQYSAAEYVAEIGVAGEQRPMSRRGWGHSPVESCVITALAAGVKRLHIGHRDPRRNDLQIAEFEGYARELMRKEMAGATPGSPFCEVSIPHEGRIVTI